MIKIPFFCTIIKPYICTLGLMRVRLKGLGYLALVYLNETVIGIIKILLDIHIMS